VVGSGNYAIAEVNELINLAAKITILTDGKKAPQVRLDSGNIEINTKKIEAIDGKEKVETIKFEDGQDLKLDGVFVATRCCSAVSNLLKN